MKGGILVRDWDTFKKKFLKRFQDVEGAEIYKNLTRLHQEGNMDDYFSNLLVFVTSVQDINEEQILQIFISGIKMSIQIDIILLHVKYVKKTH